MQPKQRSTVSIILSVILAFGLLFLLTGVFFGCEKAENEPSSGQKSSVPWVTTTTDTTLILTTGTQTTDTTGTAKKTAVSGGQATKPVSTKATTTAPTTVPRKEVSVTIPEGYSFMQIARLLEAKNICTAKAFYTTCQSYSPASFSIPASADRCFKMEGYLFPDTYRFYEKDNPVNVLVKMLNNYRQQVGNLSDSTLILASIIEKEARTDANMKLVSSVYHNRLANSAKYPYLDADPTREYVNDFITGNSLLADTGKYAALYNTCQKRVGLPAGPICSPGLRAINAAKNPTDTPYYFFFYGKDNQNHYSKTYEEHQAAMEKYGVPN